LKNFRFAFRKSVWRFCADLCKNKLIAKQQQQFYSFFTSTQVHLTIQTQ